MANLADHLDWAKRNLLTLSMILFAFAAFAAEVASALPNGVGAHLASVAIVATAAARGLVNAVELLTAPKGAAAASQPAADGE